MIAMMSFIDGGPSLRVASLLSCHAGKAGHDGAMRITPVCPRQRGDMYKKYAKCRNLWQREIASRMKGKGRRSPSYAGFDEK
jgi:hypothetical protein